MGRIRAKKSLWSLCASAHLDPIYTCLLGKTYFVLLSYNNSMYNLVYNTKQMGFRRM